MSYAIIYHFYVSYIMYVIQMQSYYIKNIKFIDNCIYIKIVFTNVKLALLHKWKWNQFKLI